VKTNLSPEAKAAIGANMPNQELGELTSPLMMAIGDVYTLSFGNVPPGSYEIICTPHVATGMKMTVTVK
jgi:plastocyanin